MTLRQTSTGSAALALALVLATLVAVAPVDAQAPGYPQIDPRSVRAEYAAEVLDRINDVQQDWGDLWATDQVEASVDLYWEDAMLIPPGGGTTPIRGRDRIRCALARPAPRRRPRGSRG